MTDLVRLAVVVPLEQREEAIAALLPLAPDGFEERSLGDAVELAVYASRMHADRVRDVFPTVSERSVEPGWEHGWRAFHRPVVVGGLWLGPPWESAPPDLPQVVIDPGRAFGTGAHPTTRLCVELLAGLERGSLLDVGCGSGVLSIAAARLGFGPLVAVDVDPVAVDATIENARANGVEVDAFVADGSRSPLPETDVAVANILRAAVEEIVPRLDARHAVTSGYLAGERPAAPGWRHVRGAARDGWAADVFCRR